jgi:hypothetical protein
MIKTGKGRKKGCVKSGGRQKGVVNKITADHKALITASNPIEFLIHAFTTGTIKGNVNPLLEDSQKHQYLTLTYKERCDIAINLAKKIVPDLKAVDMTSDGKSIQFDSNTAADRIIALLEKSKNHD